MGHVVKNHATEEERQQRLMPRTRRWYVPFLFLVGGRAPPPPPPLLGRRMRTHVTRELMADSPAVNFGAMATALCCASVVAMLLLWAEKWRR